MPHPSVILQCSKALLGGGGGYTVIKPVVRGDLRGSIEPPNRAHQ